VLLREAIAKTGKAGSLRRDSRPAAFAAGLMAHERTALILELLRFNQELRRISDFELPGKDRGNTV